MAIIQYATFAGTSDSYGEVPTAVLGGAEVFTIEIKLSTADTKSRSNYYLWGTIAGREISGSWKDDWSLCINDGKLCFWARPVNNGSTSTYRTYSEAVVNDGMIHAVAVRSNVDGSIDLFCDGQNVAHQGGVNAKITDAETMLLAFNRNANSELNYQLYELRCWNVARADEDIFAKLTGNENGLRAWYIPTSDSTLVDKSGNGYDAALFNVSYSEINSLPISLFCDVSRKVKNADRTWIYTNLGLADTLINGGTTLTDLPITQSKTGSAFYQPTRAKCFDIPATHEIWLKFDVYFDGVNRWRAYNGGANGTTGITTQTDGGLSFFANDNNISPNGANVAGVCKKDTLQTVLLHMISGVSEGIIETWVDGDFIYRYAGNVNDGEDFADIYLQSDGAGTFFSNVIISNAEIDLATNLVRANAEFDVKRRVIKNLQIPFDVSRRVLGKIAVKVFADIKINVVRDLNFLADVSRTLFKTCRENFDVSIMDIVPVNFSVDVERQLYADISFFQTDSENIFRGEGNILATSVERPPLVTHNPARVQSIELNLAEQQLTDQVIFTAATAFEILQYIGGQYFDYCYKLRIESRTKQGALFTYRCCHNLDKILYTLSAYPETTTVKVQDDTKPTETEGESTDDDDPLDVIRKQEEKLMATGRYCEIKSMFEEPSNPPSNSPQGALYLGTPILRMGDYGDFVSSITLNDLGGRTYVDQIREVLGWTSRIPHKMINFYIRDDKIFIIQRGHEEHLIDITGTKHTEPVYAQELVRMFWGATPYSQTEITEKILGTRGLGGNDSDTPDDPDDPSHSDDDDDDGNNPWLAAGSVTTTNSSGTTTTTYSYTESGVLMKATTAFTSATDEAENFTETIQYSYNVDGLLSKATTTITHPRAPEEDRCTEIAYGYITLADGKTFLAHETTTEYEKDALGRFVTVDMTVVTKSPTGRGQGGTVDSKGRGNAGGNIGDDRVTPYQLRSAFNTSRANTIQILKKTTETTINGFLEVDPSFPLLYFADRAKVTRDLEELNRTTKETVTITVYNFEHIIDFNDRIILYGAEYFLVSNTVRTTPRIYNEQSLTLVRWL